MHPVEAFFRKRVELDSLLPVKGIFDTRFKQISRQCLPQIICKPVNELREMFLEKG